MLERKELVSSNKDILHEISTKIAIYLRETMAAPDPVMLFTIAYAAYVANEDHLNDEKALLAAIASKYGEPRAMFVKEAIKDHYNAAFYIAGLYNTTDLLSYLHYFQNESGMKADASNSGTPVSLSRLAMRILDIKEDDYIADFGCGAGDFITLLADEYENNSIYGIDINTYMSEISSIKADLFSNHTQIELGDMFSIGESKKFDKIFSNYPFGMRLNSLQAGGAYIEELHKRIPDIKRATSSDWIFNSLLIDHLNENGKAVAIMTNGSTWNSIDRKIREYFVKCGLVEAVISLPERLFDYTSIGTTMIVLSKGNKAVRLVDARDICIQGRRQNILSEENIAQIADLLTADTEASKTVEIDQLMSNDCVLNPTRYLEKTIEIENGVEFGSLIKRITRGAPIKASDLDDMVSDTPTDTQYLMLANIQNGMISDELPYLKELDAKYDKYCINNRNLLLSKNGAPFKVAVAEVEDGRKLLGNGNLFIIELDETKVNPYFLKAFLDSEAGTVILKSIAVGASIPNISAEALKKLIVPLPPMDKQNEIANLYQAKQDEIKVLQLKIQKAQNDLRGIFGEV